MLWSFLQLRNVGFCVGAECVLATGVMNIVGVLIIKLKKLQYILMAEMALVYSSCGAL